MSGVIVGVDDSQTARRAARRAAAMAEALGERLHLVMGVGRGGSGSVHLGSDRFEDDWVSHATQVLHSIKIEINAPDAETSLGCKDPAKAIIAEAERVDAELIVVGNRRVQGAGRVFGAIASDVLRRASCDVFVAHTSVAPATTRSWGQVEDHGISSAAVFDECDAKQRHEIDSLATPVSVSAGCVLTAQGDVGKEFGVLLGGSATVTIDGDVVAKLGPGDHFGEMALLPSVGADANRTATVIADSDLDVSMMSVPEFSSLFVGYPDVAEEILRSAEERALSNACR